MATQTTNLGLVKPDYTDAADIAVINTNMDTIDAQERKLSDGLCYVVNGNTSIESATIPVGKYVRLVNSTIAGRSDGIYTVKTAIPVAPATIDNTYLNEASPIAGGVANDLNSNITIIRKKTALYQASIPANGTVTQILSNVGIVPDVISGYSLIGGFPMIDLDLITVGYNAKSEYVCMHNWHTDTQRPTLSMIYLYAKN